jgi:uncharacterized GH25 family protein
MIKSLKNCATALAVLLTLTVASDAHDFWIEPTVFQPAPGDRTEFNLRVGQNLSGDSLPWIPEWFLDYRVIGPDGPQPVRAIIGDIPAGGFTPDKDALYTVGYFSGADLADLDPEKFNKYLMSEGLEHALETRRAAGKENTRGLEYYSRCAKSIIKSGNGKDTTALSAIIGYPLEIIPLNNPYALGEDKTLNIRVLFNSKPISNLAVFAFNSAEPEQQQRTATNADGEARIAVLSSGTWLIKAVHIYEIDNPNADWESFWASLTFRL